MSPYQSLYRRYRSQSFAEVLGQDHVTGALRNAVRTDHVAHAYLFSGPRGTGKTSTARILAKALNCTALADGEPCGSCDSCVQVTAGTSMDVTELDAASNNGVDSMRELVSRASLGTAGRRKVYIVDEVHMLSTAASNALLKTLEEPPDHVVFVLATTDPQKVLPTIRSRTQHFEFHLLGVDVLAGHLRFVNADAGLGLDDDTLLAVARRGNGSARDALSALDQVAAAGGLDARPGSVEEIVAGLVAADAGAVLGAVDALMGRGRDPRQLGRDLVDALREGFLALMAPDLSDASPDVRARARSLGPAALVRGIELLGDAGVAMREAVDPRVVLEVALIKLVRPELDPSPAALLARLERLEQGIPVASSGTARHTPAPDPSPPVAPAAPSTTTATTVPAAPTAVTNTPPAAAPAPRPGIAPPPTAASPAGSQRSANGGAASGARAALAGVKAPVGAKAPPGAVPPRPPRTEPAAPAAAVATPPRPPVAVPAAVGSAGSPEAGTGNVDAVKDAWLEQLESARMTRAMLNAGRFISVGETEAVYALPNDVSRAKCEERRPEALAALEAALGRSIVLRLVVDDESGPVPAEAGGAPSSGPSGPSGPPPDDQDDIDLSDLRDAPPVPVASPMDAVLSAFPGAELVEE